MFLNTSFTVINMYRIELLHFFCFWQQLVRRLTPCLMKQHLLTDQLCAVTMTGTPATLHLHYITDALIQTDLHTEFYITNMYN